MTASLRTGAAHHSRCVVVPHHPRGARLARLRLAADLGPAVRPGLLVDVVAVAAELIGNAIRHAGPLPGGVVRVAWRLTGGGVEIRVTDGGGDQSPRVRAVGEYSPDGRGLTIVSAISDRWGVDHDGLGQCVWARVSA
ncbi:ATP-binding protein [Rhizomonospora bruguierae]|uniref:ATP-binding protein n=1 Tax=Rhizomonospora bruguierae TaxID=1581705 RepID=UPI001BCB5583|nr:ATP-binding protein [Micromonospora sp. NBRC 107566]